MTKRLSAEDIKKILEEKKIEQYDQIKKDTERKIFIVEHREEIIKYTKLTIIILVAIPFSIYFLVTLIGDIFGVTLWEYISFDNKKPVVVEEVIEEEKPPVDFKIEVMETNIIKTDKKRTYDVLGKIRNADINWGVSLLKYKFILKDEDGNKVGEKERESYILPQQERYLVEIGLEGLTEADKVELEISLGEVQKLDEFKNPQTQFKKTDVKYFIDKNKSRVGGELVNNSPFGFDKVDMYIIVYDLDGRILGINYTNIDDFLPKSNRYFSVFWNKILSKNENSVQIEIESNVDVYEAGSFMGNYGTGQVLEY